MTSTATREPATKIKRHINWEEVIEERQGLLAMMARAHGVRFTDNEATGLIALTVRGDIDTAKRALETLLRPGAAPTQPRRGTITAIGMIELPSPGGRLLLLRRGSEAWLVPDEPDGWERREPWPGDLNSVRWIGGPVAVQAFARVGAPI